MLLSMRRMALILYRNKVISGVLHYWMCHSSNKLYGRLHFCIIVIGAVKAHDYDTYKLGFEPIQYSRIR